jgi:putative FmdB family regulatory protein
VPIYEYQCESCPDKFEVKQSMKDDALTACPQCGKTVQRLISSPAIMFKGSGWYVTDYSDKMKPSAGSDAPVSTTGEKKEAASPAPGQPTSTASATPAAAPPVVPASTPSSTSSSTSSTTPTTTPASSTAK